VDAIVEEAGVSKGTFYYHFRRKEDILVELGWATVDRVGDEAERAYEEGSGLNGALDVAMAGLARRVLAMPRGAVTRTIQEFIFTRPSQTKSPESDRHAFLSGLLRSAQLAGELPPSVNADEVADVLNHVLIRTILESMNGATDEPLEPMLDRRARLVLYGMDVAYPGSERKPGKRQSR
jgi:AcrR family transcriptional regulator